MKNISLMILTATLAMNAQASTSWVETPFWKAPRVASFKFNLVPSAEIKKECAFYKKLIYKEDGSLTWITSYRDKMERMRDPEGKLVFNVSGNLEQAVKVNPLNSENDKLPYYTQDQAITGVILEDANELKVKFGPNSYSALTSAVGLESGGLDLIKNYQGKYTLKVDTLDVACDLLNGDARLVTTAPSYIYLTGDTRKMHDFYNSNLLPKIHDIFDADKSNVTEQALKLGLRAGKVLEEEFVKAGPAQTEVKLLNIYRILFNAKTLSPSPIVKGKGQERYVVIDTTADGPSVPVTFE